MCARLSSRLFTCVWSGRALACPQPEDSTQLSAHRENQRGTRPVPLASLMRTPRSRCAAALTVICFGVALAHLAPAPVTLSRASGEGMPNGGTHLEQLAGGRRELQAISVCSDVRFAGRSTLAAGGAHTCAVSSFGVPLCWGGNDRAQASVPAVATSSQASISAGLYHTCSLSAAGGATCWGWNYYGQTSVPAIASSGQVATAVGDFHTCSLSAAGGAVCWGRNHFAQNSVPAVAASGQVAIAAGWAHTCALSIAGGATCWGNFGEPMATSGQVAISAGHAHTCTLSASGLVACRGWNYYGQTSVPAIATSRQVAIAAGYLHTCSLSAAGGATCWGSNGDGQTEVPLGATSGQVAIAAGRLHTCALSEAGGASCWGSSSFGQTSAPASALSGIALPCLSSNLLIPSPTTTTSTGYSLSQTTTPPSTPSLSGSPSAAMTSSRTASIPSTPSSTSSKHMSPTPTPLCRAPVSSVTMLSGLNGTSPSVAASYSGNAGMYPTGSCARDFGTFFGGGPRLVYHLHLGDSTPLGGTLTLSTCGLTSDNTVLYLGTGCPTWFGSFNCLVGNDNAGDTGQAPCATNALASTLAVTASSRYFFVQVGGASGADIRSGLSWSYAALRPSPTSSRSRSRTRTRTRTRSRSKSRSRKAKRAV